MKLATHFRPYQLECPTCRDVAALHARADSLQPQIGRMLPRALYLQNPSVELTPQERGAADWSLAISSCLRRGMELHKRCASCSILLGPGHTEEGADGFCRTHSENQPVQPPASEKPDDVLSWIAGSGRS